MKTNTKTNYGVYLLIICVVPLINNTSIFSFFRSLTSETRTISVYAKNWQSGEIQECALTTNLSLMECGGVGLDEAGRSISPRTFEVYFTRHVQSVDFYNGDKTLTPVWECLRSENGISCRPDGR